jgi:hypothetical protein
VKATFRVLGVILAAVPLTAHVSPLAAQTSATIYNDGRALIRRTFPVAVPRGASTQALDLGVFDPGSLFSPDSAITITGVQADVGQGDDALLRRAVGRTLVFRMGAGLHDTVSATVVSVLPPRFRLADGSIVTTMPGTPSYPAEAGFLAPPATVSLSATQARRALGLAWFAPGSGGWQASYQAIFGGGRARVSGAAVLEPGQLSLDSAEIQLLAGQVSRAGPAGGVAFKAMGAPMAMRTADAAEVAEQKVGEFHLYTLPGRVSLRPGVATTVALFDPAAGTYEKTYVVAGALPWWGGLGQDESGADLPVRTLYVVHRPRKTDLGDRPLPAGVVRMFEPDSAGRLQLIGEAAIDHTPAGEDLRLDAGQAFDLTAKRVQTSWQTGRDTAQGRRYLRTWAVAAYADTLRNAGAQNVTVDLFEERGGEWSVLASSVPAERISSTKVRFRVKVPAGGQALLTYRVRVVW